MRLLLVLGAMMATVACAAPEPTETANQEPAVEASQPPAGVVNFTQVDDTVACAGATPPVAMAQLAARGFRSVINFRTAEEEGADVEAGRAAAENAGLQYFHLPFRSPSANVTESFLEVMADPTNRPVLIHCGSANRVGAMWLIKRVMQDDWPVEEALVEAQAIGLRSKGLKDFALEYVAGA